MEARDEALFRARLAELDGRAGQGSLSFTRYLTPHELAVARAIPGQASRFVWGGWPDAERKRIFFVPDYAGEPEADTHQAWLDLLSPFFGEEIADTVTRVRITGSGYRVLAHRDYLGSILALGLERSALGDIVIVDDYSAVLFCDARIADYLSTALERIGADKVKIAREDSGDPLPPRATRPIRDTIASPRLDCVVAALTNLSRERAQSMIRVGEVEVNFLPETRTDAEVHEGDMLSLRGYGRFVVRAFDGETKRGRLRLLAEQYV